MSIDEIIVSEWFRVKSPFWQDAKRETLVCSTGNTQAYHTASSCLSHCIMHVYNFLTKQKISPLMKSGELYAHIY